MASSSSTFHRKIPKGVPSSEVSHFQSIPLAQATLKDAAFTMYSMSRTITHHGRGHTLMAGTWNTDETIAHLLSFYRPPSPGQKAEVRRFYTFGAGLNAHPDLLHGGVIACILDSSMGNAVGFALPEIDTGEAGAGGQGGSVFTAQLNVSYKAPVRASGTVMARSWVKKVEEGGRKIWVEGVIDGGDGGEVSHARAEELWVRVKRKEKGGGKFGKL